VTRGFSSKETLLGLVVILLAAGILFAVGVSMRGQDQGDAAAERMRRVYVALSLYEESVDGMPAPDLSAINLYLPEPACYVADGDPYLAEKGPFPVDGSLPSSRRASPYRISLGYLWAHRPAKAEKKWDWATLSRDDNVGFLANEWSGKVAPTGNFGANVSGNVLRLNRDGSLIKKARGGPKPLGDLKDLFGK